MAIIQHFDPGKNLFFVVWQGAIGADEWFDKAAKLVAHPSWSTAPRLLADLQFVHDTSSIMEDQISQAVKIYARDRKALSGKQIAIVARDQFGKARRVGDLLARFGVSFVVFSNLDTACLFLGLDVLYAAPKLHQLHRELRHKG